MRAREEFDTILRSTLELGWSEMSGHAIQLVDSNAPNAELWFTHRVLGGFFTQPPNVRVRHFLRDGFRGTPNRRRAVPQWILGTQLSTRHGLRLTSIAAFGIVNPPTNSSSLLILPGNQRIRIFNFANGVVRTILKTGFASRTMQKEIDVRQRNAKVGFMLPIDSSVFSVAENKASWFEEQIFSGYALPRCPPWLPRQLHADIAMRELYEWSMQSAETADCSAYTATLVKQCQAAACEVSDKFGDDHTRNLSKVLISLASSAEQFPDLLLGDSHGDFQPGNIMVSRDGKTLKIIDWEHSATRSTIYDRLVLGLHTRSAAGLATRWSHFLAATNDTPPLRGLPISRDWRRSAASLVALEDLLWYLRESLSGPFFSPSAGLLLLISALESNVLDK